MGANKKTALYMAIMLTLVACDEEDENIASSTQNIEPPANVRVL